MFTSPLLFLALILTRENWSQSTRGMTLLIHFKKVPIKKTFVIKFLSTLKCKTMTPLLFSLVIFLATEPLVPTIAGIFPSPASPRIEDVKQRPRHCPPPPPLQFWNFGLFLDATACNQPSQIWPGLNDYRTMIHSGIE